MPKESQLYNEELKLKFINETESEDYKKIILSSFKKFGIIEAELGKDISDFTYDNFVHAFESLGYTKNSTYNNKYVIVRKYIKWCIENKYVPEDRFAEIDKLKIGSLNPVKTNKEIYYTSLDELISYMKSVYESAGCDRNYYVRNLAYFALIYLGFDSSNIVRLKIKDVDYDNCALRTMVADENGGVTTGLVTIPQKVMDLINEIPKDATFRGDGKMIFTQSNPYLFRTFRSEEMIVTKYFESNLIVEYKKITQGSSFNRRLLFTAVRYSGMCERIKNDKVRLTEGGICNYFKDFITVDTQGAVTVGISTAFAHSLISVYKQIYNS